MDATAGLSKLAGERAEPGSSVTLDTQWCPRELGMRIAMAAREAAAMHIEAQLQERVVRVEGQEIPVDRTQAASLALLARRVRVVATDREVAS